MTTTTAMPLDPTAIGEEKRFRKNDQLKPQTRPMGLPNMPISYGGSGGSGWGGSPMAVQTGRVWDTPSSFDCDQAGTDKLKNIGRAPPPCTSIRLPSQQICVAPHGSASHRVLLFFSRPSGPLQHRAQIHRARLAQLLRWATAGGPGPERRRGQKVGVVWSGFLVHGSLKTALN